MRKVRLEKHDDEYMTRWGDLVAAYPELDEPMDDETAQKFERAKPDTELYRLAAEYLHITLVGNINLEAAALALKDAAKYASLDGKRIHVSRLQRGKLKEAQAALDASNDASAWASTVAQMAIDCLDRKLSDADRQARFSTFHQCVYDPESELYQKFKKIKTMPGYTHTSVINSMAILIGEFAKTGKRWGLILDSTANLGAGWGATGNLVSYTRDLYLEVISSSTAFTALYEQILTDKSPNREEDLDI